MKVQAKITICGKKPILFHSFGLDAIPLERKARTGVAGNDPEEWKRTVLTTKARQLYLEPSYIFGCLRDAGKHIKEGRRNIQSKITSTLQVLDDVILLDRFLPKENELTPDRTEPVYLDIRSVKNPTTRGRNVRYRVAAAPGWRTSFVIEWDETIVATNLWRAVLKDAGDLVGLGDGRSIGFGRFDVVTFEVETNR